MLAQVWRRRGEALLVIIILGMFWLAWQFLPIHEKITLSGRVVEVGHPGTSFAFRVADNWASISHWQPGYSRVRREIEIGSEVELVGSLDLDDEYRIVELKDEYGQTLVSRSSYYVFASLLSAIGFGGGLLGLYVFYQSMKSDKSVMEKHREAVALRRAERTKRKSKGKREG